VIVIDASALIEALGRTNVAPRVAAHILAPEQTLHAPHIIDLEIVQVLRRWVAAGDITQERGREALADLAAVPLTRYPHVDLLPRVWELRGNLTAYDAAYVALAEALDAPLVTRDRRLAASPGHTARVELV